MTNPALADTVMRLDSGKGHMFRLEGNWYDLMDAANYLMRDCKYSQDEAIEYIRAMFKEYQHNKLINRNIP